MTEHLTAKLRQMVEQEVRTFLGQAKLANLASADWIEQQARDYVQNATAVLNPLMLQIRHRKLGRADV
jgi:hypothetical protein